MAYSVLDSMNSALQYIMAIAWVLLLLAIFVLQFPKRILPPHPQHPKESLNAKYKDKYSKYASMTSLSQLKDLYHKLHHLEKNPDILPRARNTLIYLLSEALESVTARISFKSGIASLDSYDEKNLAAFLNNEDDKVSKRWEEYNIRRSSGSPRELLRDREFAREWIKQAAPLKFVDGAWLGHVNKITTPFALRSVTKNAWQIFSEECGDGLLEKHHAHMYWKLVNHVDPTIPQADDVDFLHPRHSLNNVSTWKAAVAQLLISLFPHEFLPEILGYNLHFERLTEETLIASKELKELNFDPYYFLLHICIDNADSGHTAMAMRLVVEYMKYIRQGEGVSAEQRAWKGIQAGYLLSESLSSAAAQPDPTDSLATIIQCTDQESAMVDLFQSKAAAANRLHCSSRMVLGHRSLNAWLDPIAMKSKTWVIDFLQSLSRTERLVRRGESQNSNLIRELSWLGKMFGAFTDNEVRLVQTWIDLLPPTDQAYWTFIGQPKVPSSMETYPSEKGGLLSQETLPDGIQSLFTHKPYPQVTCPRPLKQGVVDVDFKKFLPLWFAHPALLESFVAIPAKTGSEFGCAILRFLRAQNGFGAEGPIVAGIDEYHRPRATSLVDLGLDMAKLQKVPMPASLYDVLDKWPCGFATSMLQLSLRPERNVEILLGLASAFVDLHEIIATSTILQVQSRAMLREISRRERESLGTCLQELRRGEFKDAAYWDAYSCGRDEIDACFVYR